jgi:hypothetical protein
LWCTKSSCRIIESSNDCQIMDDAIEGNMRKVCEDELKVNKRRVWDRKCNSLFVPEGQ